MATVQFLQSLRIQEAIALDWSSVLSSGDSGQDSLLHVSRTGSFVPYHDVGIVYNRALKRAGLPYTATHVMRHGGGQMVYYGTGSDLEIAKQALGNTSLAGVLVYAKRDQKPSASTSKPSGLHRHW